MQVNELVKLDSLSPTDALLAGGKAGSLAYLIQNGFQVPCGSVILSSAFNSFIEEQGLIPRINVLSSLHGRKLKELKQYCHSLQEVILTGNIPSRLQTEIFTHFASLNKKYVAVRSSAVCEDSQSHSWAGRLDTFLNTNSSNLLANITKCWASIFSLRSVHYALAHNIADLDFAVAVILQEMIVPEVAGVCFTVNPVSHNRDQIVIEAGYGLGESIVSGLVTPDRYVVGKQKLDIHEIQVSEQAIMISQTSKGVARTPVPIHSSRKQKLSNSVIIELARLCKEIEKLYGNPQDIEWALERDNIFILQARPITTLIDK